MSSRSPRILRRMSLMSMLDEAMHLNRQCFATIYPWTALPLAVAASLVAASQLLNPAFAIQAGTDPESAMMSMGFYMAAMSVGMVIYGVVFGLSSAVILAAATTVVRGEQLSMPQCWRWVLRPNVGGPVVLYWLGVGFGLACCIVPGVAIWAIYGLLVPVMLTEGLRGTAAFSRSSEMVTRSVEPGFANQPAVRLVGIGFVGYLLTYLASFAIQMPISGLQLYLSLRSLPEARADGAMPSFRWLWLNIPQSILGALASTAILIYVMLAVALLYTDLRAAREGNDLHEALDELGAPSAFAPTSPA